MSATADVDAVQKLKSMYENALLAYQETMARGGIGNGNGKRRTGTVEWEFRFESFRAPPTGRNNNNNNNNNNRGWPPMMYDEYMSVVRYLQTYGWRIHGSPTQFTRWSFRADPTGASRANARVTQYAGSAMYEWSVKADDVVGSLRGSVSARDLHSQYHVRTSMQSETIGDDELSQTEIQARIKNASDTVRRELTRTSFLHPRFPALRIDCSEVSQDGAQRYEIELEILPERLRDLSAAHIVTALRHVVLGIQFSLDQILAGPRWEEYLAAFRSCLAAANVRLPQPVSVNTDHVVDITKGEFAVTAKADGQRCLLFVYQGRVFRVDSFARIIPVPLRLPDAVADQEVRCCLFDAEYIVDDKTGEQWYLVFDIYRADVMRGLVPSYSPDNIGGAADVDGAGAGAGTGAGAGAGAGDADPPFIVRNATLPIRFALARNILAHCAQQWKCTTKSSERCPPRIVLKDMIFPVSSDVRDNAIVFDFIRGVLTHQTRLPYRIDGLIFTSLNASLPTGGGSGSGSSCDDGSGGPRVARWPGAVKYKSSEETTNDFQLGRPEISDDRGGDLYFPLQVSGPAHEAVLFEGVLPCDPLGKKHSHLRISESRARKRGRTVLDDGTIIELREGMIVECAFDMSKREWRFSRLRSEKRFPNAADVAYANWQLIHTPIVLPQSVSHALEIVDRTRKGYYDRANSNDLSTENARFFHNFLKRIVLDTVLLGGRGGTGGYDDDPVRAGRRAVVADLGVGRGGDLGKYRDHYKSIEHVLGIDPCVVNLNFCRDRYRQMVRASGAERMPPLTLLQGSACTSFLQREEWLRGHAWSSVSGGGVATAVAANAHPRFMLPAAQLDVAVMHFALHYLWGSEKEVDQFIWNVKHSVRPGGWLAMSCFRGTDVAEALRAAPNGTISLRDGDTGDVYFRLKANYDVFGREFCASDCFGFEVELLNTSIRGGGSESSSSSSSSSGSPGDGLREFLVHPGVLVEKMRRAGFRHVPAHVFFATAPEALRRSWFRKPLGPLDEGFQDMYLKWMDAKGKRIPPEQLATYTGWNSLFLFQASSYPSSSSGVVPGEEEPSPNRDLHQQLFMLHNRTVIPRSRPAQKYLDNVHIEANTRFGYTVPLSVAQDVFRGVGVGVS